MCNDLKKKKQKCQKTTNLNKLKNSTRIQGFSMKEQTMFLICRMNFAWMGIKVQQQNSKLASTLQKSIDGDLCGAKRSRLTFSVRAVVHTSYSISDAVMKMDAMHPPNKTMKTPPTLARVKATEPPESVSTPFGNHQVNRHCQFVGGWWIVEVFLWNFVILYTFLKEIFKFYWWKYIRIVLGFEILC